MCYYGNTAASETIGKGTPSQFITTGETNIYGMNDTIAGDIESTNFWGIENCWGSSSEYIDNLYGTDIGINILNYDGDIERQIEIPATKVANIEKMLLGEKLDMFPTSVQGTKYTTYYCDLGNISQNPETIGMRSGSTSGTTNGPFYINTSHKPSTQSNIYTSRLQYNGRVIILE